MIVALPMSPDLTAARREIEDQALTATALMQASVAAAAAPANRHTFVVTCFDGAIATADAVDRLHRAGAPLPPLAGLAVSVKDLFDMRGEITSAASRVLADAPPAITDCPAVARLRRAGAALIARTNMTEFAFSGVGINPHHGTPPNPATALLDPRPRIPGGSTSGGAVSVATGAAWAALGSDTGGSIRIPAALQGLVGFKSTARLVPTAGAIPLSTTLDTACAITRSVRDAVLLHEVLADRRVTLLGRPRSSWRFGVPANTMLDGLDPVVSTAFARAIATLRASGAVIEEFALPEIDELPTLNAGGGFSTAEAWAWHRRRIATEGDRYDPRVASRIRRGEAMSAADYIDLLHARRDWICRTERRLGRFDAMLSPTVPCTAPLLDDLITDDAAFFAANARLLRNPSVVNVLDGCALSLPMHAPGELPAGLMVWSSALRDDTVLEAALAIESALRPMSTGAA